MSASYKIDDFELLSITQFTLLLLHKTSIFSNRKSNSNFYRTFEIFANKMGCTNNSFPPYSELSFTVDAPPGELPSFNWMQKVTPGGSSWPDAGVELFSRIQTCEI